MTAVPAFAPIAIVGRACTLPGALSPEALWAAVVEGRDLLGRAPPERWAAGGDAVLRHFLCSPETPRPDRAWSDRGGYVSGFEQVFEPRGFLVDAAELAALGPLQLWTLHTARAALADAGLAPGALQRGGAVLGNLSFPSADLARFAEAVWSAREPRPDARHRFGSGLPALLLERALGLEAGAFALDAACASSLYAIRFACDLLHEGRADLVLAGAVNCADDLFLHIGFSALGALSASGRSRPFHAEADGLVPAEGAAFVALERLDDAVRLGHRIHGVIRGVGLSNDGRGRGFLVPAAEGQERALRAAYQQAGVEPATLGLLECHATGTVVGDATELRSLQALLGDALGAADAPLPIGSLKSNLGHPITAAGAAGLIKVLEAMRAGVRPPTLHVERPLEALAATRCRLVSRAEPWERRAGEPRRAAISAFGFGGNNAHLIVEEWREPPASRSRRPSPAPAPASAPIAIVGVGVVAAGCPDRRAFAAALLDGESRTRPYSLDEASEIPAAPIDSFEVDVATAGVPPSDLRHTLAQQLLLLDAGGQAAAEVAALPRERTGVYAGMGVDAEIARYGARWRLAARADLSFDEDSLQAARDAVAPALDAAGVVGTMPNIVANRLNRRLDLAGQSCSVSAEEASGLRALELACRALRSGELDAAVVGAVDLSCEPVHQAAARACLPASRHVPGDAAVALVLRRLDDALRAGDTVYATLEAVEATAAVDATAPREANTRGGDDTAAPSWGPDADQLTLTSRFGHAHAAAGLLHLAAAAICLRHRIRPDGTPWLGPRPRTVLVRSRPAAAAVDVAVRLREHRPAHAGDRVAATHTNLSPTAAPARPTIFHVYEGADTAEVLASLEADRPAPEPSTGHRARLVVVAEDAPTLARRRERARRHLRDGAPAGEGVHFRAAPVAGELALVFASAGTAYRGMGRDLLRALPALGERVDDRFGDLEPSLRWALGSAESSATPSNTERLWGASAICRLHAELTLGLLGLRADAAIGYSSGESTSLFATGVWTDIAAMRRDIEREGLFDPALGGRYQAVARHWGLTERDREQGVEWAAWNVLAEVERVRELLQREQRVHLAIVHTARNCVIAGEAAAAARVVEAIGRQRCHRLEYDVAAHVPEVAAFREEWLRIHRRPVTAVPGIRFYSAGHDGAYRPSTEACARAILRQAVDTLDFPRVIEQAWRDGVRCFVEHGPQAACAGWIREILGERAAACAIVSLDRGPRSEARATRAANVATPARSHGLESVLEAVAALIAAGVALDRRPLECALGELLAATRATEVDLRAKRPAQLLRLPAHPPPVRLPRAGGDAAAVEHMAPAPALPSVLDAGTAVPDLGCQTSALARPAQGQPTAGPPSTASATATLPAAPVAPVAAAPANPPAVSFATPAMLSPWQAQLDSVRRVHQEHLEHQRRAHARFLAGRYPAASPPLAVNDEPSAAAPLPGRSLGAPPPHPTPPLVPLAPPATHDNSSPAPPRDSRDSRDSVDSAGSSVTGAATAPVDAVAPIAPPATPRAAAARSVGIERPGPSFDRAQLQTHASGRISEIFGPLFAPQDDYARQVRMPEPPLLLADRVTGLEAVPGVRGTGTIWTETDVRADSWYLHRGRMPAGVMIEAGQADLMLISYMGADLLNRGERVYRLLGCELTYLDELPRPGETLAYEIRVDGHAEQDGIRLFFFHYDCHTAGRPRIRVRGGQAGFFTDQELRASAGVLWSPADAQPRAGARVDPPEVVCTRSSFDERQVRAFADGRPWECFGDGFELAKTHTDTPTIQSGEMLFLDRVPALDLAGPSGAGGPWSRGYLRAEADVTPDEWYFAGHFKNDPCMPGTLMFEGCVQAMSFLIAAMGFTLRRDGWRFQPVTGEPIAMRCRGQVTPRSQRLVYEVFVEEVIGGPLPTVYADVLCTVDGLKAFHARRVGLQLVPSWPLENAPGLRERQLTLARRHPGAGRAPALARITAGDLTLELGYEALLACAWGRPSRAFGPMYQRFDGATRVPRLPGPPYHFLSRVLHVSDEPGRMAGGATVEVEYDVPAGGPDAWYFAENGAPTMPWAVLLEAALQPCGWLASYVGCALAVDTELCFRNLDGTATVSHEVLEVQEASATAASDDAGESQTLRSRVTLTNLSRSGSTIIVSFEVACSLGARRVLDLRTVFGFFPSEALAQQVGLPSSGEQTALLDAASDFRADLAAEPPRWFAGSLRLASGRLRMLDRITGYWPDGGERGLGRLRAERDVDPGDWYFQAHFFQDPVQPGSLGIEAMVQLLQFFLLESGAAAGLVEPRFEPLALGVPITWKYRGQVVPANDRITVTLDVTSLVRDQDGVLATASASLWCDGKRIYSADGIGMRVVSGVPRAAARHDSERPRDVPASTVPPRATGPRPAAADFTLDPEVDLWLGDHRPTWCRPALPMMSVVDVLASALPDDPPVVGLRDVEVDGWIDFAGPRGFRAEVEPVRDGEWRVRLYSRHLPATADAIERRVASARVLVGADREPPRPLAPLAGDAMADPYVAGHLFHGPAFQLWRHGVLGPDGASALLATAPRAELAPERRVPRGRLHPALLDAALHAIPHDRLHLWLPEIAGDRVAYPIRIPRLDLYGPPPTSGSVRCEVRCEGFLAAPDLPRFRLQLVELAPAGGERLWAELVVVEACFPKGPLGSAPPAARRRFLRDQSWVAGVSLSRHDRDRRETRLDPADVEQSDWLPGTIATIYGTREPACIVVKEHLAARQRLHPRLLPAALPLGPATVEVTHDGGQLVARDRPGTEDALDLEPVARYWSARLGVAERWLGQDLIEGLVRRYVRRVVLEDPEAFATLRGRSAIYVANHQVQIESILVTHLLAGLGGRDVVTLANAKHRTRWIGWLIELLASYPRLAAGTDAFAPIVYFDQSDPGALLRILGGLAPSLASGERSFFFHAAGTRSRREPDPVERLSSVFLDLALEHDLPLVPIRFTGGLVATPAERKLELPHGHARQDYLVGRPIEARELRAVPYAERRRHVLEAMNALGPAGHGERDPRPALAASVAEWSTRTGAGEVEAAIYRILETLPEPSPETSRLLALVGGTERTAGGTAPADPAGVAPAVEEWLAAAAARLVGTVAPGAS